MKTGLVMAAAVALLLAFIFAVPQPGSKARNAAIAAGFAVHGARVFDGVRGCATRDIVSIWKNGAPVQRRRYPTDSR